MTGTHWGCDTSNCGTCVVLMDGEPVKSCTVLAATADGHEISTVEGLEKDGELDPVQKGFRAEHGLQCGFCTPGMMLTARALLDRNPDPSEEEIREAISGQICRCTGYATIVRSVRWAAEHPTEEVDELMATVEERPIGYGRLQRKEDERFIRGQGRYLDDVEPARHAARRDPAQPARARAKILSIDTSAALQHPKVHAVVTGKDLEGLGPALDADDVGRHAGRAGDRQGPLPGPGGRVRDRRRPLLRARRARADRRRVRAAAGGGRTRARRSTPTRR